MKTVKDNLQALVKRFHHVLSIQHPDINIENMSEQELCSELGKCIGDIKDDFLFPKYVDAFSYRIYHRGYKCNLCHKCFIDQDEIEMHFRFQHRI